MTRDALRARLVLRRLTRFPREGTRLEGSEMVGPFGRDVAQELMLRRRRVLCDPGVGETMDVYVCGQDLPALGAAVNLRLDLWLEQLAQLEARLLEEGTHAREP
jgi:hypothetical protein